MTRKDDIAIFLDRARSARSRGHLRDALRHYGRATDAADRLQDARIIHALHGLAQAQEQLEQLVEAEASYRRSAVIAQTLLGENHPLTARSLNQLALVVRAAGRSPEARVLAEASLDISHAIQSEADAAVAEHTLALVATDMGDAADALRRLERVVSAMEGLHGASHPEVGAALLHLGELYRQLDRQSEALPLLQRSFTIIQDTFGSDDLALAEPLNNLARCHDSVGDHVVAEPLYQRAIAVWRKRLGETHRLVLDGEINLANLHRKMGRHDVAEASYRTIIGMLEDQGMPNHPLVGSACHGLSELLRSTGRSEEADVVRDRARRIRTGQRDG